MKKLILLLFFLLLLSDHLLAADVQINEDELFSEENTVIELNSNQHTTVNETLNRKDLAISGDITSAFSYSKMDKSLYSIVTSTKSLRPYMVGDFFLDARLKDGYKAFGSFELKYDAALDEKNSREKQATLSTKELFADFNFNRNLYLRAGKQVLSWGQCYLWNPTDMINVENKSFVHKLESREGTYGIKGHIPFGTAVNIYGFANMEDADEGGDVAGAGKFEFLVHSTEMAFSVWGKREFNPVYGYDISGRLLGIDIKGELSYSHGSNKEKLVNENGLLSAKIDDGKDIYKASINLGRDFDFGEKANRLNVSVEMFYNGDGYSDNPLEERTLYLYEDRVFDINGTQINLPAGDMRTYLFGHGLYEANYFSKYYAALFITLREFITSDMALTLNTISNIEHQSYILSSGLSYKNINNLTAGLSINRYLGDKDGEYRVGGKSYDILVTTGIVF
ncbi:MAG: hypothetical protein HQK62_06900 [Desulfamplus sp.]|nr:hypothetical protein [Desulfamplus sp.]